MPRNEDGSYPWPAINQWYVKFKQQEAKDRAAPKTGTVADETAENLRLKNRMLALELAEREGSLIPIEVHDKRCTAFADSINARVRTIKSSWASEILHIKTTRQAQQVLTRLQNQLLAELAALPVSDELGE